MPFRSRASPVLPPKRTAPARRVAPGWRDDCPCWREVFSLWRDVCSRWREVCNSQKGMDTALETEVVDEVISIPPFALEGRWTAPRAATAIVLFAHGSGSSHRSPRNGRVAAALRERGLATLLFDLLTPEEALDRRNVFDIGLLAERLLLATRWVEARQSGDEAPALGYFGASTGAAAALVAAANSPRRIAAVVSRGGRPDLAGEALGAVRAPTLLIVGGRDPEVLLLNRAALAVLDCEKSLEIVPGATHLFEEPGTLERVTELAADWLVSHMSPPEKAGSEQP